MTYHIMSQEKMVLSGEKLDLEYVKNHQKMIGVKVNSCFYMMTRVIKSMSSI